MCFNSAGKLLMQGRCCGCKHMGRSTNGLHLQPFDGKLALWCLLAISGKPCL